MIDGVVQKTIFSKSSFSSLINFVSVVGYKKIIEDEFFLHDIVCVVIFWIFHVV